MNDLSYYLPIVLVLGLVTFGIRFSFFALSSKIPFSQEVKEFFTYIPAIVLPALAAPLVFFHKGHIDFLFGKERFLIFIIATFVCAKTKSMTATLLFGMGLLYLINKI